MGIIRHQRHRIIDTAIISITASFIFTILEIYGLVQIIIYQLYERNIIPEPTLHYFLLVTENTFINDHRIPFIFLILAFSFHIVCIGCLCIARKSNFLFLYFLRIFVYVCAIAIVCYCIAYPLIIAKSGIKITEKAIIDNFTVTTLIYFSSQNVIITFIFSLVTLAPFVVSVPPVMHIYRKIKLNSKEHLCSSFDKK